MAYATKEQHAAYRRKYSKTRIPMMMGKLHAWEAKKGCAMCGENRPVCLDLHHREPEKKTMRLTGATAGYSWKTWVAEIKKCAVLCANCHRVIHFAKLD